MPKILLVDDEQNVLDGLKLLLGRQYTIVTATGGVQGLQRLADDPDIAVIFSDMRMPGMSGAEFLAQAQRSAPLTVRMLLTGHADIDAAIAAINEGHIFRFLTKPAPPQTILAALDAALAQHRLLLAEKVLLEETLRGSIRTLTDVLALANPVLFGRATRIRRVVNALMRELSLPDQWQIDVATLLLPLAQISLPAETAAKLSRGDALSQEEHAMVARMPEVTDELLANIPRLEVVRTILANVQEPYRQSGCIGLAGDAAIVSSGTQLLKIAIRLDALTQGGLSDAGAIAALRQELPQFAADHVTALSSLYGGDADQHRVVGIPIRNLAEGMVLAEDLVTRRGVLLVPRGGEITATCVAHLRNYRPGTLKDTLRIAAA